MNLLSENYSAIWIKRTLTVTRNFVKAAKADEEFAAAEADHLLHAAIHLLPQKALWINHPLASGVAAKKPIQLHVAKRLKFKVPSTLISNNSDDILAFIEAHGGSVIFKTLGAGTWSSQESSYHQTRAVRVTKKDIDPIIARICPAIFQQEVDKHYDVRVVIIENKCFAFFQETTRDDVVDGGYALYIGAAKVSYQKLPEAIERKCFQLVRELKLKFACIDLAVDKSGQYWFFEANPYGRFFAYELLCPEAKLLDTFCKTIGRDCLDGRATKNYPSLSAQEFVPNRTDDNSEWKNWSNVHCSLAVGGEYADL